MSLPPLSELLGASAARHSHLCPRQVLGVRIALAGLSVLGLDAPPADKRLLAILETDGCFADGVEVASGCTVGHRTLRIEDYGKIAATFVDVQTEAAFRITPRPDVRQRAASAAPAESRHYFAQLQAYERMPDAELLTVQPVCLSVPVQAILSRPGLRIICERCGEEIINERATILDGHCLCHTCAFGGYYSSRPASASLAPSQDAAVLIHHAVIG